MEAAVRQKLYIKTFGYQMNVHDSEKLQRILAADYDLTDSDREADLVLINTCSVREKPAQKLYSYLGELRLLKMHRPGLLVGVCGCVAQQEGVKIIQKNAAVDFVLGTHALGRVPELIAQRLQSGRPQVAVEWREDYEELPLGFAVDGQASVFVAISRGCNKGCSYCIVPQTRGREVSRPLGDLEAEIKLAISKGAREVMLLGQTVNSYGKDLNPPSSFAELVRHIGAYQELRRIRFISPHPGEITPEFYDLFGAGSKVCEHIHLPLQSGSDEILRLMHRSYTAEGYLEIVRELRRRVPDLAVTTDLIVGSPGESEADFEATLKVMEAAEFVSSFSFMFSPRPNTPAADLPGALPEEVKLERLQRLQAKQHELTSRKLQQWVGRSAEILLDGRSRSDAACWQGRSSQNIVVNLEPTTSKLELGRLVRVKITKSNRNTLKGYLQG